MCDVDPILVSLLVRLRNLQVTIRGRGRVQENRLFIEVVICVGKKSQRSACRFTGEGRSHRCGPKWRRYITEAEMEGRMCA
jgi:hypothetical protein